MSAVLYTIRHGVPHLTWPCPQCGQKVSLAVPRRHSEGWRNDWRNQQALGVTRRGVEAARPLCGECAGGEEE